MAKKGEKQELWEAYLVASRAQHEKQSALEKLLHLKPLEEELPQGHGREELKRVIDENKRAIPELKRAFAEWQKAAQK